MPRKAPTIRDVADKAGVSIATVSRVLNASGPASVEARKAVARAVSESGFRPNKVGRQLKTATSQTIGVLMPSLKNPVFADAVQGIERAAEARGYQILLTSSRYQSDKELAAVELLLGSRVDGLILTVADEATSPALKVLKREHVPFVLVFNPAKARSQSAVTVDNASAAAEAVSALIAMGHRRITMVAGTFLASDRSCERRAGYERAMRSHGLTPRPVIEAGFENDDLHASCAELFSARYRPTALFCSTDMLALGAIRALTRLGYRVPDDVSVVGFDGIALGELTAPSLATVVQPAEGMGQQAVHHLLERVTEGAAPRKLTLSHRIRSGESWAPLHAKKTRTSPTAHERAQPPEPRLARHPKEKTR